MGSIPRSPTRPDETNRTAIEAAFASDRLIVLGGIGAITLVSWAYTCSMVRAHQSGMAGQVALPHAHHRTAYDLAFLCLMWTVMMVAMMAPAVAPAVLMFARMNRSRRGPENAHQETALFAAGYFALWTAYSGAASLAQWGLQKAGLVSPSMAFSSTALSGMVLTAAGIYQWTPLKNSCLSHCRTPLSYLMTHWRTGPGGALRMGMEHGWHCVLCCWLLMLLLLVAGAMNLLWMGAITALVLVEKLTPGNRWITPVSGALLTCWGVWMLAQAAGLVPGGAAF
jgi:predicted metal-binding membrane protein